MKIEIEATRLQRRAAAWASMARAAFEIGDFANAIVCQETAARKAQESRELLFTFLNRQMMAPCDVAIWSFRRKGLPLILDGRFVALVHGFAMMCRGPGEADFRPFVIRLHGGKGIQPLVLSPLEERTPHQWFFDNLAAWIKADVVAQDACAGNFTRFEL